MNKELVWITIRGEMVPFPINKKTLSKNLKNGKIIASYLGKRPGEPTGQFPPNEDLSMEFTETIDTVLDTLRKLKD